MSIGNSRIPVTYDDYRRMPESLELHELVDGELFMAPAPTTVHQTVTLNLASLLLAHVRATGCGRVLGAPVDVVLARGDRRDVLQPDVLFVDAARIGIVTAAEVVGAPDLIVEVLSPRTETRDRGLKQSLYARAGVREYWLVDPAREAIEQLALDGDAFGEPVVHEGDEELVSVVVPGFAVAPRHVFER